MADLLFGVVLTATILQRLLELRIAKNNLRKLLAIGGREFGSKHYPIIVGMHVSFFLSLVFEYRWNGGSLSVLWPLFLSLFAIAQLGRMWVLRTMGSRWTTRVVAVPGERLISHGPFAWTSHPNYIVVAIELFTLPLIFNLWITAVSFTLINLLVLLKIRLPVERAALEWSQSK